MWGEIIKEWQQRWDQELKGRHLYLIIKRVGIVKNKGGNGREETIMTIMTDCFSLSHSSIASVCCAAVRFVIVALLFY